MARKQKSIDEHNSSASSRSLRRKTINSTVDIASLAETRREQFGHKNHRWKTTVFHHHDVISFVFDIITGDDVVRRNRDDVFLERQSSSRSPRTNITALLDGCSTVWCVHWWCAVERETCPSIVSVDDVRSNQQQKALILTEISLVVSLGIDREIARPSFYTTDPLRCHASYRWYLHTNREENLVGQSRVDLLGQRRWPRLDRRDRWSTAKVAEVGLVYAVCFSSRTRLRVRTSRLVEMTFVLTVKRKEKRGNLV